MQRMPCTPDRPNRILGTLVWRSHVNRNGLQHWRSQVGRNIVLAICRGPWGLHQLRFIQKTALLRTLLLAKSCKTVTQTSIITPGKSQRLRCVQQHLDIILGAFS